MKVRHFLGHTAGLAGWTETVTLEDIYDAEKSTTLLARHCTFVPILRMPAGSRDTLSRKPVESFCEDIVKALESSDVPDQFDDIEDQDIDVVWVTLTEPALIVLNAELKLRLCGDESPKLFAAAKRLHNLFVITLDDEVLVELWVTHFDILQAEDLADVAEDRRTVNGETKAAGIGKRSPHPRVLDRHRVFAADEDHLCVFIEADGPFSRTRLEFCSAAEAALDNLTADLRA